MPTLRLVPATGLDIEAYQGDSLKVYFQIKRNGVPEDLTDSTFRIHVRNGFTIIFLLTQANNSYGKISIETDGKSLIIEIPSEAMKSAPTGSFMYDVEQTYPDGRIKTRVRSAFSISEDVTK